VEGTAMIIKSPLQYFPTTVGKAELTENIKDEFNLFFNGISWMGYNASNGWQAAEFVIELNNAYGRCVTTGLGLGIIQTLLSLNPAVTEIVVYEKQQDIIDMFKIFAEHSNFDTSKIKIICQDADNMTNINCDCLFLDHFELESNEEITQRVKKISNYNTANFVWYWPASNIYLKYVGKRNIEINKDSFYEWANSLGIKSFPVVISDTSLNHIKQLKHTYKNNSPIMSKIINNLDDRNALLNIFNKEKSGKISG
jgi:hypothetical protein